MNLLTSLYGTLVLTYNLGKEHPSILIYTHITLKKYKICKHFLTKKP